MRIVPLLLILLFGSLAASEPARTYPLWDGVESVADYAKKVNLPPTKTLELGNGVKLELVLIPAGKFVMGVPDYEKPVVGQTMTGISGGIFILVVAAWLIRAWRKRTRPQFSMGLMLVMTFVAAVGVWGGVRWNEALKHLNICIYPDYIRAHAVMLTPSFYMGKYDVTQEQYQAVIGTNPSHFKGKDNPVEMVSWEDAQAFCKKVTEQTKDAVRLPTEAEWEYACRAGTTTEFYSGDDESDLDRVAWYAANSKSTTHPVGQKESNKFGLYDMHGNVVQWCQDWEGDYPKSLVENPQGPDQGGTRMYRGGGWNNDPMHCQSDSRFGGTPGLCNYSVGFRVVVVPAFRTP